MTAMDIHQRDDLAFPQSLPEFQRQFPDDAACAAYLKRTLRTAKPGLPRWPVISLARHTNSDLRINILKGRWGSGTAHPMGESKREELRVDFDRSLEFSSRGLLRRPVNSDSY